jgi:hypothetical protein
MRFLREISFTERNARTAAINSSADHQIEYPAIRLPRAAHASHGESVGVWNRMVLQDPSASGQVPPDVAVEDSEFADKKQRRNRVQSNPGQNLQQCGVGNIRTGISCPLRRGPDRLVLLGK